jgi:hypothetical protein
MPDSNNIRGAIEDLAALGVLDAHELADGIVELMIAALMRDPSIPPRSVSDWWARFANARARIVEQIHRRVDGHVDVDDVLRELAFAGVLE